MERLIGPLATALRRVARESGAIVIDPVASLCDAALCPATAANGEPMYHDFAHLRPSYVRDHVTFLDRTLLESGTLQPLAVQ